MNHDQGRIGIVSKFVLIDIFLNQAFGADENTFDFDSDGCVSWSRVSHFGFTYLGSSCGRVSAVMQEVLLDDQCQVSFSKRDATYFMLRIAKRQTHCDSSSLFIYKEAEKR